VEQYLQLADDSEAKRCVVLSGQLTAFLRARWGLVKVRGDSDRHHALDAVVVAACSHDMVNRLSGYSKRRELENAKQGFIDPDSGEVLNPAMLDQLERHFPTSWPHFREELEARLKIDNTPALREVLAGFGTYTESALLQAMPLFVSRMRTQRTSGEIHKASIASFNDYVETKTKIRTPLTSLTLAKLKDIVGYEDPRNARMIGILRERLEQHGGNGKKAFSDPLIKPSKSDKSAPVVRTIAVWQTQRSGMRVRGGVADLGDMLRVDVFKNGSAYELIPRYVAANFFGQRPEPSPGSIFLFSLSKNDVVKVHMSGQVPVIAYFVLYESDGRLTLRAHDQPQPDKKFFRKSVASALLIEKYHVDVLGKVYGTRERPVQ
jgi:CRISPR-associated endonuclease Csn1